MVCAFERPVYFLHLHKNAGTTLCNLALQNGVCAPVSLSRKDAASFFGKNCNPSIIDASALWTNDETELRRYIAKRRVDFFANEWSLPAMVHPGTVRLVVTFRAPIKRLLSHCGNDEACTVKPENGNFATMRLSACDSEWRKLSKDPPLECETGRDSPYRQWVPAPFATVHDVATFFATPDMLAVAKKRLELFDTVLVVERFAEAGPLLKEHLGWTAQNDIAHLRKGTNQSTDDRVEALNPTLHRDLQRHNLNDLFLYDYANTLFDATLRKLQEQQGIRRGRRHERRQRRRQLLEEDVAGANETVWCVS